MIIAWGPFFAVAAIGLVVWAMRANSDRAKAPSMRPIMVGQGDRTDGLNQALQDIASMNQFQVQLNANIDQGFREIRRVKPPNFATGIEEISSLWHAGYAVSIDTSAMDIRQAMRLIDFCNGLISPSTGWVFLASDEVVILLPGAPV